MTRDERTLAREFVADMGKKLESLLGEDVSQGPAEAKERTQRLGKLLAQVERYEKRARSTSSQQAVATLLGVTHWPEAIRKRWQQWRRNCQRNRQREKRASRIKRLKAYAMIRLTRRGLFIWKFTRRNANRQANQRRADHRATKIH